MVNQADVIIVGTGASGLFCALKLPNYLKIVMLTKDEAENSDSFLAQGGICMLRSTEDFESYYEDTMKAGHYKNNPEAVALMIRSSPQIINDLVDYQVDFRQNGESFAFTREGAHSTPRILYHDDVTGKEITSKLLMQVKKKRNIEIFEQTTMIDLICQNKTCFGIIAQKKSGEVYKIFGNDIVLATGGIGGLFRYTTNYQHITGDALGIAIKQGIELENINYIQIHPTTLYSEKKGRSFLISESVRGEGGVLLNAEGKRFVNELLPRDLLTEAIEIQKKLDHKEFVRLSVVHLGEDVIKNRFPNIYRHCLEEGYDMTKEPIPVTPAQHYFMGGIKVDLDSCTSFKNLYAVGETSCNGVHGANRLASNSLLESLVFAERAADKIAIEPKRKNTDGFDNKEPLKNDFVENDYRAMILEEIKRKDIHFYEQWCNN